MVNLSIVSAIVGTAKIRITDALRQMVDKESYSIADRLSTRFDLSYLASGVYYFKIAMGQQSQVFKVINVK